MKRRTKNTLRALAKHLGLKVIFVDYLGDGIHGKLLPREKRILINAHKPRCEHIFTLLHEIGHFLIHVKKTHKIQMPRYLEIHSKSERIITFFSKIRRSLRFLLNTHTGKEWEADLWAMCAFVYLAKHIGCRGDLLTFLDRHPEKTKMFLLATWGVFYGNAKTRIQKMRQILFMPFKAL